jgi:hypothetical protein
LPGSNSSFGFGAIAPGATAIEATAMAIEYGLIAAGISITIGVVAAITPQHDLFRRIDQLK